MKDLVLKEGRLEVLNPVDCEQIRGGYVAPILLGGVIRLLIEEWPTTKQAAVDAWNGTFNPPKN